MDSRVSEDGQGLEGDFCYQGINTTVARPNTLISFSKSSMEMFNPPLILDDG
jgi:hypothetical protein